MEHFFYIEYENRKRPLAQEPDDIIINEKANSPFVTNYLSSMANFVQSSLKPPFFKLMCKYNKYFH